MPQTSASRETAEGYLADLRSVSRPGELLSMRFLLNAYETHDKRSIQEWFHAVKTENHSGPVTVLFHMEETWKDYREALYVIDDGQEVTPHYVAGWNVTGGFLMLSPIVPASRNPHLAYLNTPRRTYFAYTSRFTAS